MPAPWTNYAFPLRKSHWGRALGANVPASPKKERTRHRNGFFCLESSFSLSTPGLLVHQQPEFGEPLGMRAVQGDQCREGWHAFALEDAP